MRIYPEELDLMARRDLILEQARKVAEADAIAAHRPPPVPGATPYVVASPAGLPDLSTDLYQAPARAYGSRFGLAMRKLAVHFIALERAIGVCHSSLIRYAAEDNMPSLEVAAGIVEALNSKLVRSGRPERLAVGSLWSPGKLRQRKKHNVRLHPLVPGHV